MDVLANSCFSIDEKEEKARVRLIKFNQMLDFLL